MISDIFLVWLSVLFLLSAGMYFFLFRGLRRSAAPPESTGKQGISVIVAARNEDSNIGPLLESLVTLDYPPELFEIIVVNDRSTDNTVGVVNGFLPRCAALSLIDIRENPTDMPNKKYALQTGIGKARFDILAFTDADCIVPTGWLKELSRQFTDETGMVAGFSPYGGPRVHPYLQYEEFKNTVMAAAAVEAGMPFMCTGRNFAYRKRVFTETGGFEPIKHSISGDDELFLQLAHRTTQWRIRYMIGPESAVLTIPPASFGQFIHQRTRHISASRYYLRPVQLAFGVVHLFHLSIALGAFFAPLPSLIFFMLKLNLDAVLIAQGMDLFKVRFSTVSFFLHETMLILYSFFIGPLGFLKDFQWKESRP
jgi:cellulose synthase/poly-beta-1,6-N-acetylglucosamine synthase-like glycosyltransferase